jgi:hypothetical protein
VKINVEGGEYQVIAGMSKSIAALPAGVTVLLEVAVAHLHALHYDLDRLLNPFTNQGFHLFRVENRYTRLYAHFQGPKIALYVGRSRVRCHCRSDAHAKRSSLQT